MHGQPRKALKQEDEAALSAKAEKLRSLQAQFLANHHNNMLPLFLPSTFFFLSLFFSPSVNSNCALQIQQGNARCERYTAWNYRKLAVQHLLSNNSDSDSHSIFQDELKLVEIALRKNFKSYGAWHHRKWVLSKGHSSMDNEMRLLNGFQKADPRNFHAWNCRWLNTASF
ncbi:hypothetical protein JHK85_004081 [Glycine max]|nr:hypothetical protein JHK85_004081 [Glycine max]